MGKVCGACGALYAGGDGRTCPRCQANVDAQRPDASTQQTPATARRVQAPPTAAERQTADQWGPWTKIVVLGLLLVPLSSFFGVRAWTFGMSWIWEASITADFVFTLGTVGAFVASSWAGARIRNQARGVLAAVALGWLMHWLVYGASWSLVVATEPEEDFIVFEDAFGFVTWIGSIGISLAALAGGAGAAYLRNHNAPWPQAPAHPPQ